MAIEINYGVETNWVGAGFNEDTTVEELFGYTDEEWNEMTPEEQEGILDEYARELVHEYANGYVNVV